MNNKSHKGTFLVSLEQMDTVAQELYEHRNHVQVYTFEGSLGAGKTTLVQRLLGIWGVLEVAPSPTFSYLNTYTVKKDGVIITLFHFDMYRLRSADDFINQGLDEFLYQPYSWVFIEWAEIIKPLLKHNICTVTIDYESRTSRVIAYDCSMIE